MAECAERRKTEMRLIVSVSAGTGLFSASLISCLFLGISRFAPAINPMDLFFFSLLCLRARFSVPTLALQGIYFSGASFSTVRRPCRTTMVSRQTPSRLSQKVLPNESSIQRGSVMQKDQSLSADINRPYSQNQTEDSCLW